MKKVILIICSFAIMASGIDVLGPYSSVFKDWKEKKVQGTSYLISGCCYIGFNTEPLGMEEGSNLDYASVRVKKLGNQPYKIIRVVDASDGSLWCVTYARIEEHGMVFNSVSIYSDNNCPCQNIVEQRIILWEQKKRKR